MKFRIGQGLDIHPFAEGRALILGGIEIDGARGLQGHSDADALTHAICDALLGALALGDLGQHFPDTDPRWEEKSSLVFLSEIRNMVEEEKYKIANIDTTIVTEDPKLAPHIPKMRQKLADTLEIEVDQVGVKATRPEKMGALGRKEGLLVLASTILFR